MTMKTVLITTTIHLPEVLARYRHMDSDVLFIVAGDKKTPHNDVRSFLNKLGNAVYYSDIDQEKLGYLSSKVIGWNKIMRRNIALLEAIKLRPDVIISIDDDNLPLGSNYFKDFVNIFNVPYTGIMAIDKERWFNVGCLLNSPVFHRGFPYNQRSRDKNPCMRPVIDKQIGIASGLWFGDPDIDAMDRIVNSPTVLYTSDILQTGIIIDNSHFAPVNSQNTAYVYELAPLMMVLIGVGRYDDIWASYIAERVMMETDYHIHYGRPFVWQQRNPQNLWKNLGDELFGMEYTPMFCNDLLSAELGSGNIIEKLYRLYEHLSHLEYIPREVIDLGRAWCKDMEDII